MIGKFISSINVTLMKFEDLIVSAVLRKLQPGMCITGVNLENSKSKSPSISDILKDGFLWAVPKHRRPLQKRLSRKFGWPKYNWKPLVPKTNLLMCRVCGHFHESDTICGHCYKKVKEETVEIQKAMEKTFKLDPIKDDIVVLYEGEDNIKSEEFWKNQRIIEMPKKRPSWFHNNLLQPTSQKLSDSKEIKPNDLS